MIKLLFSIFHRTLKLLHDINNSNERRMNSSLLAFDKLIESNLSAKYCVKGQLATKDIIGLHFYDPGKVGSFVLYKKVY